MPPCPIWWRRATIGYGWYHFAMMLVHSVRPMPWKHWPMRLNSNWPSYFCTFKSWVKIFDLKLGSVYEEVLRAKSSLVKRDVTGNLLGSWVLGVLLEGDFNSIGLLQTLLDKLVWCAIGTQGRPASIPVKLGHILRLDKIWHCHNLYLSWFGSHVDLDCVSLLECAGNQLQWTSIIIVKYALVGEWIRGWNVY